MYDHFYLNEGLCEKLTTLLRKFGKHIQKKQLEIPEYASSFVDYKALKKVWTLLGQISDALLTMPCS